jgi:hypothetical protein
LALRSLVQEKAPLPAGSVQPVVSAALVNSRKPPAARAVNWLFPSLLDRA